MGLVRGLRTYALAFGLVAVASITYSSWLLQGWLNPDLSFFNAFSSELAAVGQPFAWLFRTGDLVTALLIAAVAYLWWRLRAVGKFIPIALGVFSAATIVDVLSPMQCAPTLSTACRVAELNNELGISHTIHALSSIGANGALIAMLVWALLFYRRGWLVPGIGGLSLLMEVVSGVTAAFELPGYGLIQRVSTGLIVVWWISFAWQVLRRKGIRRKATGLLLGS